MIFLPPLNWGSIGRSYEAAREPDVVHMFYVMVDGLNWGDFQAVTGITKEVDTEQIAEGGRTGGPRTLIKGYKPGTVSLKWGHMDRTLMWDWIDSVQVGGGVLGMGGLAAATGGIFGGFRREVTVLQLTRDHTPYRIYHFHKAFPISLKAGDLNTQTNQQSIEDLTLSFDSVTPIIIAQDLESVLANVASAVRSAV